MGNRYGRKQKRAHLAMIAERDVSLWDARQALLREGVRSDELERKVESLLESISLWDNEIRSMLGPYTSFSITEPTYRVDHPEQIRQMPVVPPLRLNLSGVYSMEESISYHIETMLHFVAGLDEEYLDRLRRVMTLRVLADSDRQGEANWAISESLWRDMKRDGPNSRGLQRFIHRIAGDLMRLLVAPPRKKQGDDLFPPPQRSANVR